MHFRPPRGAVDLWRGPTSSSTNTYSPFRFIAVISCKQRGHFRFFRSHLSIQPRWKTWPHGNLRQRSPSAKSLRQTAQDASDRSGPSVEEPAGVVVEDDSIASRSGGVTSAASCCLGTVAAPRVLVLLFPASVATSSASPVGEVCRTKPLLFISTLGRVPARPARSRCRISVFFADELNAGEEGAVVVLIISEDSSSFFPQEPCASSSPPSPDTTAVRVLVLVSATGTTGARSPTTDSSLLIHVLPHSKLPSFSSCASVAPSGRVGRSRKPIRRGRIGKHW
mmetsp:Transcript_12474/g.30330  ORF Transcript_12474/g.30330 Transcript_12474/m.30330 type:complete len:281 (-) Transcript_12474:939-1781(-)